MLMTRSMFLQVAAGNDGTNADHMSPASAPTAVTVGATTFTDARASFSNYGTCLDIFAPGDNVISCGTSGPNVRKFTT